MKNNKLHDFSKLFLKAFLVFSFLNIAGLVFQNFRISSYMERNPESGNYLGMLIVAVFFLEIYFLLLALWSWGLTKMKRYPWLHLVQLILLFLFGILFGVIWCARLFLM